MLVRQRQEVQEVLRRAELRLAYWQATDRDERQSWILGGLVGEADRKKHARSRCFLPFRSATNPPLDGLNFWVPRGACGFDARPGIHRSNELGLKTHHVTVLRGCAWTDLKALLTGMFAAK